MPRRPTRITYGELGGFKGKRYVFVRRIPLVKKTGGSFNFRLPRRK